MKTLLPVAGAFAAAITLSMSVLAQEAGVPTPGFAELDLDGDGHLDQGELEASGIFEADTLATYDSDGDGLLGPAEYEVLDRNVSGAGAIVDTDNAIDGDAVQ